MEEVQDQEHKRLPHPELFMQHQELTLLVAEAEAVVAVVIQMVPTVVPAS